MEKSKRERVGGGIVVLLPPLLNLASSPLFSSSLFFTLIFSNYLKACYRLTTCIPSFPAVYGIYSTWTFNAFGTLLLISRNGFGSTNFSTALRPRNCYCFFFLVFFLLFFLCQFMLYFFVVFFCCIFCFSPQSHPLSHPPPPAPDKSEWPFVLLQTIRLTIRAFLAYPKSTGCFVVWLTF